jgi:putative repressor|nr:MAG TPA: Repressor protein CI [Caudoviricetes sp.]DAS71702.1 MAG TPA: Repressor protein CI [Caudoviricetes sp.]
MTEQQLRELIELKYGSVRQMALKIDMPASTINSILNRGILKSNVDNIFKICSALDIRPESLAEGIDFHKQAENSSDIVAIYNQLDEDKQANVVDYATTLLNEQVSMKATTVLEKYRTDDYIIDYVEGLVAAGHGTFQEDNLHMEVKLRTEDVPESYDTIAKVAGDSMEPLIEDNDLLFIKVTSQVDINSIGIFQINGKNFVKKLKRDYDGSWYLQSLNSGYEEIHLSENDDIRTIGEVVDIYKV